MIIHIRVKANSKIDSIEVKEDGIIFIRICAARVEGKANKYLLKYLATLFNIPQSKINIVKGLNNPYKTISIEADETYLFKILTALKRS